MVDVKEIKSLKLTPFTKMSASIYGILGFIGAIVMLIVLIIVQTTGIIPQLGHFNLITGLRSAFNYFNSNRNILRMIIGSFLHCFITYWYQDLVVLS